MESSNWVTTDNIKHVTENRVYIEDFDESEHYKGVVTKVQGGYKAEFYNELIHTETQLGSPRFENVQPNGLFDTVEDAKNAVDIYLSEKKYLKNRSN